MDLSVFRKMDCAFGSNRVHTKDIGDTQHICPMGSKGNWTFWRGGGGGGHHTLYQELSGGSSRSDCGHQDTQRQHPADQQQEWNKR